MIDLEEEQNRKIRCFLVGKPGSPPEELKGLAGTLGMETAGQLILTRLEVQPVYGIGKGKAQEIAERAHEVQADCILFDFELTPTKQRNWEKLAQIPCFDRQEVIIRIFAQRAQTKEAVLQAELARLTYSLPRLAHSYGDMARQRGGSYGSKGSGETQLELDQRGIRERIYRTKKELEKVVRSRETQRKKRKSVPVPECALIGYTNAGKSSLLNALTGADSFVEDKLFATLDPLTRRLKLKSGKGILLTDTVGFISSLPHNLIDAFKATLSAAKNADLQLLIIDSSDINALSQYRTVCSVLEEIGAASSKRLIVLNKCDIVPEDCANRAAIHLQFPDAVHVSARTHEGFDVLAERISKELFGTIQTVEIPAEKTQFLQSLRADGVITEEVWLENSVRIKVRATDRTRSLLQKYTAETICFDAERQSITCLPDGMKVPHG